jgi:hypothetical protein
VRDNAACEGGVLFGEGMGGIIADSMVAIF